MCSALLKRFRSKDDFLLVTLDETWVHYYEPENKAQIRRAWVPEAKEVQDTTICWQDDCQSFGKQKALLCWTCYRIEEQ